MYRLVLYVLLFILGVATVFSVVGILPSNPASIIGGTLFIIGVSWGTNKLFSRVFGAQVNVESIYITGLILALIVTPATSPHDVIFLFWVSVWAMASKYIFAIHKKHLFNPAAIAIAITAISINQGGSWWIGTASLMPFVLFGGLLITRKIHRFDLVVSFIVTALIAILGMKIYQGGDAIATLGKVFITTPILFFAFIMLTEPLTTPPTRVLRIWYGALTGILFAPWVHIGAVYSTPELALLVGNIFAYVVSPKYKLILKLKEIVPVAKDVYDFVFEHSRAFRFAPGQYLEWTLGHTNPDNRGNRRYFTIASAPTEENIRIGIKFYKEPSSFKEALGALNKGETIIASQLSGDFVLPKDPKKKFVFIAGGIGVTPFRSMIKYLIDKNEPREIVLLYANKAPEDIAYKNIFDEAKKLGIRTIYTITEHVEGWTGNTGYVNEEMIRKEVPNFLEYTFYISGPHAMVESYHSMLHNMGVAQKNIKTDYFPGF